VRLNQQRRVLRLRPVVWARRREGQRESNVSRAATSSSVSSSKMVRVAMVGGGSLPGQQLRRRGERKFATVYQRERSRRIGGGRVALLAFHNAVF
jgi:hypothetical protein